jgi:outer membrane protein assembly factor BamA
VVVRFVVAVRPLIRSVVYRGDEAVSVAEILEMFRERKVRVLVDSLYIEEELERAARAIQEYLAERGRPNMRVTASAEPVTTAGSVEVVFQVAEKR